MIFRKLISIIVLSLFSVFTLCAQELTIAQGERNNSVQIKKNGIFRNVVLSHQMDGYIFSCDENKVLIWGVSNSGSPESIGNSSIQRQISFVDIRSNKVVSIATIGMGILAVNFSKIKGYAIVETPMNLLSLALKNGRYTYLDAATEKMKIEQCH